MDGYGYLETIFMSKSKNEPTWGTMIDKLDLIARLLAYMVADKHDNLEHRAVALNALGLSVTEIARVCDTTRNTISVRLTEAKKKSKRTRTTKRKA